MHGHLNSDSSNEMASPKNTNACDGEGTYIALSYEDARMIPGQACQCCIVLRGGKAINQHVASRVHESQNQSHVQKVYAMGPRPDLWNEDIRVNWGNFVDTIPSRVRSKERESPRDRRELICCRPSPS